MESDPPPKPAQATVASAVAPTTDAILEKYVAAVSPST
jgi:hypothetical protein